MPEIFSLLNIPWALTTALVLLLLLALLRLRLYLLNRQLGSLLLAGRCRP